MSNTDESAAEHVHLLLGAHLSLYRYPQYSTEDDSYCTGGGRLAVYYSSPVSPPSLLDFSHAN